MVFIQSVSITASIVSSNDTHGDVQSIQYYVIKFVSDLRQVGGFFSGTLASTSNKTDRHDIAEILLKVALNTITPHIRSMPLFVSKIKLRSLVLPL